MFEITLSHLAGGKTSRLTKERGAWSWKTLSSALVLIFLWVIITEAPPILPRPRGEMQPVKRMEEKELLNPHGLHKLPVLGCCIFLQWCWAFEDVCTVWHKSLGDWKILCKVLFCWPKCVLQCLVHKMQKFAYFDFSDGRNVRVGSKVSLFSLSCIKVCISTLFNELFTPVLCWIKVSWSFHKLHKPICVHFPCRWLTIPNTKNPKELQSSWACQMKSRQKKSLRTFLSKAKSVSSPVTNLRAITWTCWSYHQLKTFLHLLWHPGIFFSPVMMTLQERKLLLVVSIFLLHHGIVEQE